MTQLFHIALKYTGYKDAMCYIESELLHMHNPWNDRLLVLKIICVKCLSLAIEIWKFLG